LAAGRVAVYIWTTFVCPAVSDGPVPSPIPERRVYPVKKDLTTHLQVERYGDFWLTDAIRPGPARGIVPRQGYRQEVYHDRRAGFKVPALVAAISREELFETFLDLLDPLDDAVDVVVETSHESRGTQHLDLFREGIDLPVFKSHCCEFEELLMHDGCTGVAALSTSGPMEVQFDDHKLLVVYATDLKPFARILESHGVRRDDRMKIITQGEHLHSTDPRYQDQFARMCRRLGVGEAVERVNWGECFEG